MEPGEDQMGHGRMLFSRTRDQIALSLRQTIFKVTGMQRMLDQEDHRRLEMHMGFPGQFEEHRRFQFEFLCALGLQPGHSVLEIGCGPLTLALPVIEYLGPGKYVGVDVRPGVLDVAYRIVGSKGLSAKNPRLICSDSFAKSELAGAEFDFVWAFSVLFHLTDELAGRCISQVREFMGRQTRFLANVNGESQEGKWLEFPFQRRDLRFYETLAQEAGMTMKVLGTLEELGLRRRAEERLNHLLEFQLRD